MKTKKRKIVLVAVTLLSVVVIYLTLYILQLCKINAVHGYVYKKASDLPSPCTRYVATYGLPLDDPDVGGVWVVYCDVDSDGEDELIVDDGDLGRGAANALWAIWKKLPTNEYKCLGMFFCDEYNFIPPWTIYGMPYIWCRRNHLNEWVPWRNGCYNGSM